MIENSQILLSLLTIGVISILLVITGLKKQPGIGVIGAVIVIAITLLVRGDGLDTIGFSRPASWPLTIIGGLVLGILIQFFTIIFIEPFSEKITNTTHDHSIVENVKGNWVAFVQWMLLVWVFVAFIEEGIYRGFLMTEFARIFGSGSIALAANVFLTAVVFGMSHGYQSWSGIVSTGIIGAVLGVIFITSDFNIWFVLFTHGFIDTAGIALIALEKDKEIREKIWKA